jgi:hypothetical protein
VRRRMRQRYPGRARSSIVCAGASSIVTPLAQHHRRPRATGVKLRRQLGGELARDEADLRSARVNLDRVGVVLVAGIAPELERTAGRECVRAQRVAAVPGPRQPGHMQPSLREQRRVACEVRPGLGIDELVPRQPDLAAVVGVPVALGELDAYLNERILNFLPTFEAYCPLVEPVQTR